ncbi:MAG: hypothetical protein ACE5L6_06480 [Candidatus Bathyarchaeia archaeon]
MLVDDTKVPRNTYYACPYCKSRIDIVFESKNLKFANHSRSIKNGNSSGCPYYFGYLKLFSSRSQIPEECLVCPRLTECTNKGI